MHTEKKKFNKIDNWLINYLFKWIYDLSEKDKYIICIIVTYWFKLINIQGKHYLYLTQIIKYK